MSYNLLDAEWIPVLYHGGEIGRVGASEALERAREIRCIALASPLDVFAVHRFLLTLIYWKADSGGGVARVRTALLKGKMPRELRDDIKKEVHCFDLFHSNAPFLQDPIALLPKGEKTEQKSVGSLFAELASGTNIAHFHHGNDKNMRLCLPCATLGMLRVVPWSQGGGRGLTSSVHGAPPIIALALGDNLAHTLGLNLIPLDGKAGKAKWTGHFMPTDKDKPIPYLEALTWNPRIIHLLPEKEEVKKDVCWNCGRDGLPTLGQIVYLKNDDTKKPEKNKKKLDFKWQDAAAFYDADEKKKFKPRKSMGEKRTMAYDDINALAAENSPKSRVVVNNPDHKGWLLIVSSTDGKAKTFDHRIIELPDLSAESIRSCISKKPSPDKKGLDGWTEPRIKPSQGTRLFVRAAASILSHSDWVALTNAAYMEMHEAIDAFDVFSTLYRALRDKHTLPSKGVAWLVLKLMASVPKEIRRYRNNATFNPMRQLPKRQTEKFYPVSLPSGRRLEAELRSKLEDNFRRRRQPVDWAGLCHDLNKLLD